MLNDNSRFYSRNLKTGLEVSPKKLTSAYFENCSRMCILGPVGLYSYQTSMETVDCIGLLESG